jgi:hypothetical protein
LLPPKAWLFVNLSYYAVSYFVFSVSLVAYFEIGWVYKISISYVLLNYSYYLQFFKIGFKFFTPDSPKYYLYLEVEVKILRPVLFSDDIIIFYPHEIFLFPFLGGWLFKVGSAF